MLSASTCIKRAVIVFTVCLINVRAQALNGSKSCVFYYEKGVEAYLENRYEDCVLNLEQAVEKYRFYSQKLNECRLKCLEESEFSEPLYPTDVENLRFYEKTIRNTLCILKCKNRNAQIFDVYHINREAERIFEERKPYEYLHICYFQTNEKQKAASSAFTYLAYHPEDEATKASLKHYSNFDDVDMNGIVNYEAKDYVYFYIHGADAYEKKDWKRVLENMEESLLSYLHEDDLCRMQCEGPFDQGWYPDFVPSIANHFTYCLKCKSACPHKLSSLNGERHDDLLPSHYHFLQYAYYKSGNLLETCRAVASYLLFYPADEVMLQNKRFYENLPKFKDEYFKPRQEALHYVQRQLYENRLLKFIDREFRKLVNESNKEGFHM